MITTSIMIQYAKLNTKVKVKWTRLESYVVKYVIIHNLKFLSDVHMLYDYSVIPISNVQCVFFSLHNCFTNLNVLTTDRQTD